GEDSGTPVGPAQPEVALRDDEDAPGCVPGPARAELDADACVLAQASRQGRQVGGILGCHANYPSRSIRSATASVHDMNIMSGQARSNNPLGPSEMPRKIREDQVKTTGQPIRRVRYGVAMSLDGFIAGPNGEADWIIMDPEIDFNALYSQFDTLLMGRRTFEAMKAAGGGGSMPGMQVFVFSRTLRQEDHPGVTIVDNPEEVMAEL